MKRLFLLFCMISIIAGCSSNNSDSGTFVFSFSEGTDIEDVKWELNQFAERHKTTVKKLQSVDNNVYNVAFSQPIEVIINANEDLFEESQPIALTIPEGVKAIGKEAFLGSSIQEVVLPQSLEFIDDAAFKESSLKSIALPTSLTMIPDELFCGCRQLKHLEIPSSVTNIGERAFAYTGLLPDVLPKGISVINKGLFEGIDAPEIIIPDGITEIREKAFFSAYYVKRIVFAESVQKVGDSAFYLGSVNGNKRDTYLEYVKFPSEGVVLDSHELLFAIARNNAKVENLASTLFLSQNPERNRNQVSFGYSRNEIGVTGYTFQTNNRREGRFSEWLVDGPSHVTALYIGDYHVKGDNVYITDRFDIKKKEQVEDMVYPLSGKGYILLDNGSNELDLFCNGKAFSKLSLDEDITNRITGFKSGKSVNSVIEEGKVKKAIVGRWVGIFNIGDQGVYTELYFTNDGRGAQVFGATQSVKFTWDIEGTVIYVTSKGERNPAFSYSFETGRIYDSAGGCSYGKTD